MELIEVTTRFDTRGKIIPVNFIWQGEKYPIEATGRSCEDEQGQHVLVMIAGGKVFELLYVHAEARWYLEQTGARRATA